MARPNFEATHWASDESFQKRAKLRAVADAIAQQTGRDAHSVIELLVEAQIRAKCANTGAIPSPGWVKFEMESHDNDMFRTAIYNVMCILAEPVAPCDMPDDPVQRERLEQNRLSAAQVIQDHPWPPERYRSG